MEKKSANSFEKNWLKQRQKLKGSQKDDTLPKSVLPREFYERATCVVAQALLGKVLITRHSPHLPWEHPNAEVTAVRIVETEAYHGEDPASHSAKGITPRCAPMFEEPGLAYVYFIYGMYEMLNFVTEKKGSPGAVLIRGVEILYGEEWIEKRRAGIAERDWTTGPGKLTKALGITRELNRESLMGPIFYVVDDIAKNPVKPQDIYHSPRVGIKEATDVHWRYFLAESKYVSRVKENKLAICKKSSL
jgi:DNA-3-methyladenine glycosylase